MENKAKFARNALFFVAGVTYLVGPGCTPVSSAQDQEHHTVNVTACVETGYADGQCDSQTDRPLAIDVNLKDIQGNVLVSDNTGFDGAAILELDTEPQKFLDLGYPSTLMDPQGQQMLCPTPTIEADGLKVDATIAYSSCVKPQFPSG